MKTINSYILERLVLSKRKKYYTIKLGDFGELLFTDLPSNIEWFSEDNIRDSWLLPYEINDDKQDTNPDNWDDDDIIEISRVLYDNADTEINIDIQENKPLDAWDYYFDLEWLGSIYKFCWVSRDDLRDKI